MSQNSNRRRSERHVVVVPVQIDSAQRKERLGVTRDVSQSGTLLLSNSKFTVGEKLELTFYVSQDPNSAQKAVGEVVRVEQLQAGLQWRYGMALTFKIPLPEADRTFAELEEK